MSDDKQVKRVSAQSKELTPRMQEVVEYMFNNPGATQSAIGKALGLSQSRVGKLLRCKRVLAAYPMLAKRYKPALVPQAFKAYAELITQKDNLMVREKAAARVLESENIFETQPQIQINVMQTLSSDELMKKLSVSQPSGVVVDADIVEE